MYLTADLLLVLATVCDAFFASLSYGGGGIKIPFISSLIISSISSALLTVSVLLSKAAGMVIPQRACIITGSVLLLMIGTASLFRNFLRTLLRHRSGSSSLSFRLSDIGFVISVYLDETKADSDGSKLLSAKESVALALALSADSVSAGISAGFSGACAQRVFILSMVMSLAAIFSGGILGKKLSEKRDMSWLSGIFLILLAAVKLI